MSKYIDEQWKRATEALEYLGLTNPFKKSDLKLTKEDEADLKKHKAVLVITPAINKDFTLYDLIDRFDKNDDESYIYNNLWDEYDDTQEPTISFVYMDKNNGLYGTNKTIEQNKVELSKMDREVAVNPVEYILLQTIHREDPLDCYTWTRFIADERVRGFIRGGYWGRTTFAGAFALSLSNAPTYANTPLGFRVARRFNTPISSLGGAEQETIVDYLLERGHSINQFLIDDVKSFYKDGA